MQEKAFSVLIAEDDPHQLRFLVELVQRLRPDWSVLPAARTAAQARRLIEQHSPELCILDVELGAESGIDIAQSIPGGLNVIFVTAHRMHAADAFDCAAIDFVSKPIRPDRLEAALRRAEHQWGLRYLAHGATGSAASLVRFYRGGDLQVARVEEVVFFQAQQKYTRVVLDGQEGLLRTNLSVVMQKLDRKKFWRVHRSYIVNAGRVISSKRDELGRLALRLSGREDRVAVSRPYEYLFSRDGFA